jgi:arylformamidase
VSVMTPRANSPGTRLVCLCLTICCSRGRCGHIDHYLDEYAHRSALARRELDWRALRYGTDRVELLHFFPAPRPDAPLLVFVHGGYWQQLTEADSSFSARKTVAAGAAYAAVGYALAPRVRLDDIVAMVRRAVLWLHRNAADLGVDPDRIVLAGHSAGAQLAAMCLVRGWLPDSLRPVDLVCAAVLLSGLYELEPLQHTSIGHAIRLSSAEVAAHSVLRHLHPGLPPLVLARGEDEPSVTPSTQHWSATVWPVAHVFGVLYDRWPCSPRPGGPHRRLRRSGKHAPPSTTSSPVASGTSTTSSLRATTR